ncbi:class I SAM-dependent methyltransferase [Deltaproteobacteria bacterium TL4]
MKNVLKTLIRITHLESRILKSLKFLNHLLRKLVRKTHAWQMLVEWGSPHPPEWFDHYLDLYYQWGASQIPIWVERGVWSLFSIRADAEVMELCCGDGFNTYHFYSVRAKNLLAVDMDPQAIAHAKRYHASPNISFKLQDIRTLLPEKRFDNIIWDAAIEHFTENEIQTIMGNIRHSLTPDGILSGYTIIEKSEGVKQHSLHEYEFKSKNDLARFLTPYFANVKVFESEYTSRHNLYFYASNGVLPFDENWPRQVIMRKDHG